MHVADRNRLFARYIAYLLGFCNLADLCNHTDAWDGLLEIGTHRICFCRPCGGIDACRWVWVLVVVGSMDGLVLIGSDATHCGSGTWTAANDAAGCGMVWTGLQDVRALL